MTPEQAADQLRVARLAGRTLEPFTDAFPDLDETWGYAAQAIARADSVASGDRLVGAKLGLTSVAKQQRMGVDRPIVGFLAESMLLRPDQVGSALAGWAQPRIEPEIAFVTARAIDHALDLDEVETAIATVHVAAEIIDSRWTGYRFRLPDVLADNTSAAGVILGAEPIELREVGDLAELRCEVEVDGEVVHTATGAAILGHPLLALQLLSEHLERHGETLPAGSLVLAGALTDAVPLEAGREYRLTVEGLGTISTAPSRTHRRITSRADVATDSPERYAKQLVAHLGRKLDFTADGATSSAAIGDAVGQIVVGEGVLTLVATGDDEAAVERVEHVLGSHLERFGARSELTVTWERTRP